MNEDDAFVIRLSIHNVDTFKRMGTADFTLTDYETVEAIAEYLLGLLSNGIEVEE